MTPDQKLARLVGSLEHAGIDVLIMGGHAVRYYGIDRNTIDFDLVTSVATTEELRSKLSIANLGSAREAKVWRHRDFARFEIGRLPDGREEWIEFWLRNHLLADFASLKARSEVGPYGGEQLPFLSIADLIRSKETERESDWRDIDLLEEVQDARHHAALGPSGESQVRLLANLRSRRGMDRAIERRLLDDPDVVACAFDASSHWVTRAFLLPRVPRPQRASANFPIDAALAAALDSTEFGSPRHFGLIEITRRSYKRRAMDLDRVDKQARLAGP